MTAAQEAAATGTEQGPPADSRQATLALVLVTLLWGVSFPLMRSWQEAARDCPGGEVLASFSLILLRMPLALAVLLAVRPRLLTASTRHEHLVGAAIGATFFAGFTLQVWGLADATPAMSAFITSLCSAWVPLLAFVVLRVPVAGVTLLGLALGLAGTAVLAGLSGTLTLGGGETKTLAASVIFAGQVLLLDRLGRRVRSTQITAGFLGTAGGLALAAGVLWSLAGPGLGTWLTWLRHMLGRGDVVRDLLLLVFLPTVLAFHWMNVYQPRVSAGRAALIYLLEPVFASLFSLAWGHDPLTGRLVAGGALILGGNLLVELPYWVQRRRAAKPPA